MTPAERQALEADVGRELVEIARRREAGKGLGHPERTTDADGLVVRLAAALRLETARADRAERVEDAARDAIEFYGSSHNWREGEDRECPAAIEDAGDAARAAWRAMDDGKGETRRERDEQKARADRLERAGVALADAAEVLESEARYDHATETRRAEPALFDALAVAELAWRKAVEPEAYARLEADLRALPSPDAPDGWQARVLAKIDDNAGKAGNDHG